MAFDARHGVWLISSLGIGSNGTNQVVTSRSTNGGVSWSNPVATSTTGNPDKKRPTSHDRGRGQHEEATAASLYPNDPRAGVAGGSDRLPQAVRASRSCDRPRNK